MLEVKQQNHIDELIEHDKKYFLHPSSSIKSQQEKGPEFIFTKGEGVYLEDIEGKKVIDGLSSLWNVNVGHGRTELATVAMEQMSKLGYSTAFGTVSHEPAIQLAKKLSEISPGNLRATFFTSGGSEATDTAFKLVRHYWKVKGKPDKTKIIARKNAYHGLTIGSTSATGIEHFQRFIGSKAPDFLHVEAFSHHALREAILAQGPETVAAFIAEPVQGAGGVHVPPPEYFIEIRKICDEFDILFIADEVITGFGRTGKMFAMEHWNVTPDMMCFAKGVTSGYFPLGGVMLAERMHQELIMYSNDALFHGFTYSGHPVACAVALKNIDILEKEGILTNVSNMGEKLYIGLKKLVQTTNSVSDVRGLGLMAAIEFENEKTTEKLSIKVSKEAIKRGLICRNIEHAGQDSLVFAPPLIISNDEVDKLLNIVYDAIMEVENTIHKCV